MPVTALPPSNTPRWWLDYTVNGDAHSLMMRATALKTESLVSDVYSGFLDLFTSDNIFLIDVTGMRKAAEGSDVTLPATYTGTTAFGSGSAVDNDNRAKTFSWTGRDETGHKNKLFLFGAKPSANGDYRIQFGESSILESVVDYLQALNGFWISIAGNPMIWNKYTNTGWNDHWIRVARG